MNKKIIKTLKRVRWERLILALIILYIFIYGVFALTKDVISLFHRGKNVEVVEVSAPIKEVVENVEEIVEKVDEPIVDVPKSRPYRLTSYYTEDGYGTSSCTGSGKCTKDFQVNEKGWYTYNGKLVIAAATYECLNSRSGACNNWNTPVDGRKYFRYYDEIQVDIDGIVYDAIILDSCGASMYVNEDRIDLFVANASSEIDRGYKGINTVSVFAEYE